MSTKSRTQESFESFFGGNDTHQWRQAKVNTLQITSNQAQTLSQALRLDAKDLYFKGVLSISEAISSVNRQLYTWATIKLYYSLFFFLRCSFSCKNIAFVRRCRDLFYITAVDNEVYKKPSEKTDHKATIIVYKEKYQLTDILQSNSISGVNPYLWLMEKREEVNYKNREFHEPSILELWKKIVEQIQLVGIESLVTTYINDESYIYCFQEDHACLALPLKRMLATRKDLLDERIAPVLSQEKETQIRGILPFNNKLIDEFIV